MSAKIKSYLIPIAVLILCQLAFASFYFWDLLHRPHFAFLPYVFPIIIVLGLLRWPWRANVETQISASVIGLLVLGLLVSVAGFVFAEPWLSAATLWLVLTAASRMFVADDDRPLAGIALPMLAILLVPFGADKWINRQINSISDHLSNWVLEYATVNRDGFTIFQVQDDKPIYLDFDYSVIPLHSFFLFMFVGLGISFFRRRKAFHCVLMTIAVFFWSIFANTLRMLTPAMALRLLSHEMSQQQMQTVAILISISTVILIFSTDQLIYFIFGRVDFASLEGSARMPRLIAQFWNLNLASDADSRESTTGSESRLFNKLVWPVAIAIVVVGAIQFVRFFSLPPAADRNSVANLSAMFDQPDFDISSEQWKLNEFATRKRQRSSSLGHFSSHWDYVFDGRPTVFLVRHSNNNCIDLQNNITTVGWHIDQIDIRQDEQQAIPDHAEIQLSKPSGMKATMLISAFDKRGQSRLEIQDALGRFARWPDSTKREWLSNLLFNPDIHQTQVLVQYFIDLTDEQKSELEARFFEFRDIAAQKIGAAANQDSNAIAAQ